MDNENLYKNLVILLKMFKNRPYHLAKYLIDNSALDLNFISKIENSDKLTDLTSEKEVKKDHSMPVQFNDISQMMEFYDSFIDEISQSDKKKTKEELTKNLNDKLNSFIKNEKYEDASKIRDYMYNLGIKRINKF
jgi:cysteinyl-tRNA synthetase